MTQTTIKTKIVINIFKSSRLTKASLFIRSDTEAKLNLTSFNQVQKYIFLQKEEQKSGTESAPLSVAGTRVELVTSGL